jgi:hypothetical protein
MSTVDHQYSDTNISIGDIYDSWSSIKRAEEWAILCSTKKDWLKVILACKSRQKLVTEHFNKHPVCPETAFFYRRRLSEHFRNDDIIQQARSIAVKSTLRLI